MAALKQEYQDILNKYVKHRISNEPFSNGPVVYNEQSVIGIINDVAKSHEQQISAQNKLIDAAKKCIDSQSLEGTVYNVVYSVYFNLLLSSYQEKYK